MKKVRKYIFNLLSSGHRGSIEGKVVEFFLIVVIVISVGSLLLETVPSLFKEYGDVFYFIDTFSVIVFTIEYVLRVWVITEDPRYRHPVKGRLRYMCTFVALCDLFSIVPFYMPLIYFDLRTLRLIRFLRLLRVFKIARYIKAFRTIRKVVVDKREELLVSLVLMMFVLVLISTLMFYVEHPAQPEKFSSIPATMWWGISTLTTVGYGDIYPVTVAGKILGGIISIIGLGLFAIPTGILASGFSGLTAKKKKVCPHCGGEIEQVY